MKITFTFLTALLLALLYSLEKKNVTVLTAHGISLMTWHNLTLTKRDSSRR